MPCQRCNDTGKWILETAGGDEVTMTCNHQHPHDTCEVCALLGKANHEIHVNQILHEAWDRAKVLPIIKSMHPETRLLIVRAILGA